MMTVYEDATFLRMGIDARGERHAYLMVGNAEWKSLEAGKDYEITIQLDNETPWEAKAQALAFDKGEAFLYVMFKDKEFLDELMRKQAMRLKYGEVEIVALSMKSTVAAVNEIGKCQASFDTARDPFAEAKAAKTDPFAR